MDIGIRGRCGAPVYDQEILEMLAIAMNAISAEWVEPMDLFIDRIGLGDLLYFGICHRCRMDELYGWIFGILCCDAFDCKYCSEEMFFETLDHEYYDYFVLIPLSK